MHHSSPVHVIAQIVTAASIFSSATATRNNGDRHGLDLMQDLIRDICGLAVVLLTATSCLFATAQAQHPPAIGYMYPVGGMAGESTEVVLGGYDWTPDMQIFVHDPRITLQLTGTPGPIIVPEPPYWFSKKARRPPFLLPRETTARLTIPADVQPGIFRWQAANANGATASGYFVVRNRTAYAEQERQSKPQPIDSLPAVISGQIRHIKEVDRYEFVAQKSGPVTCTTLARGIGSALSAVIQVRDTSGRILAESADTAGTDTSLTFVATAGQTCVVHVYDLDFRGNRAFTYQLTVAESPRIVATVPSVGRRGETRPVQFIGYGVATGAAKLESIVRDVTFPDATDVSEFLWDLETDHGTTSVTLNVSDDPQLDPSVRELTLPAATTGVLAERFREDSYRVAGVRGDAWAIRVHSTANERAIDPVVAVFSSEGRELARNDDDTGSTAAVLQFRVPADDIYDIRVSDASSNSGTVASTYHLSVKPAEADFELTVPELLNAPIGATTKLAIKISRTGDLKEPVRVSLSGLPAGVTVPENIQIDARQKALNVELTVAEDAPAVASIVRITGATEVNGRQIQRRAESMLLATTIKPPFTIDAEGKDDVTKWPRGTTFPAPVLISRDEGFDQEIVLEMTSRQGRHRQGIRGPELIVKPNVERILYPVFLPEWLETTRTSRMVVNGVARVADPQGNVRYSVSRQKTRMGFLPTGALLKVSAEQDEFDERPGETFAVPVFINRSKQLTESITLELVCPNSEGEVFQADAVTLNPAASRADFPITITEADSCEGEYRMTIRATLMKDRELPVISETEILVAISEQ